MLGGVYLTSQFTMYLKGIAVFLMVMHYFLGRPDRFVEGITAGYLQPYSSLIYDFAGFAVVPMFLFLTGWGYYLYKDKTVAVNGKIKIQNWG